MKKVSGGLVLFKVDEKNDQIFVLVPTWQSIFKDKDEGYGVSQGRTSPRRHFNAAVREFEEETGMASQGLILSLDQFHKKWKGSFCTWAFEAEWSENRQVICNEIQWNILKNRANFGLSLEIDRALLLPADEAKQKLRLSRLHCGPFNPKAALHC